MILIISYIEDMSKTFLNIATLMPAFQTQTFCYIILPAILSALFLILHINLLGAWMIVLVESRPASTAVLVKS